MDAYIDPTNPKKGFNTIQLVESKNKVTCLDINNSESNWNFLKEFVSLKSITLKNCIIDTDLFFEQLENLEVLIVDSNTYFRSGTKKQIKKLKKLKKFVFNLPGDDDLDYDLEIEKQLRGNFINDYPNFPNAYEELEEIELVNYDIFLKKNKTNFDYQINSNEIYYNADFYNLSRLKKLKNIKIIDQHNQGNDQIITEKIFNFPNHKKIKVNNILIKDIKDNFIKTKKLYLDYTYHSYDENIYTDIKKHSLIEDCLEVHWASQHYNGYTENFKQLLKQDLEHIIVGPTYDFFWEKFIDYEGESLDEFPNFLKIKSLKKITFEIYYDHINQMENWKEGDDDGYWMDRFIRLIHQIIKKDITVEIDFKDIKSFSDLNDLHDEYVQIFNLFINIQSYPKIKNKFIIKNLNKEECEEYFNQLVLNKFKSIVIIDDQSNSDILKKFKNIELLHDWSIDEGLEFLSLNSGLLEVDVGKLTSKKEESLKGFLWEDEIWCKQFYNKLHYENPGKVKVIVKKSWLDNSSKLIFKNLETISFHYISKKIIYSNESYFKDKIFSLPKSIDYKNIKNLSINNSPCFSLQDLKIFTNLEDLTISNNLDENKPNFRTLPKFEKLKYLNINMFFPVIKEEEKEILQNIESSLNLESIKISGMYSLNDETGRWSLTNLDLSNFHNLKKLNNLQLQGVSSSDLKKIKSIEHLEIFKLISPTVITEEMNSDIGTIHPPMTEENLLFIKDMKNLTDLTLDLPSYNLNINNFNPEKLISLINSKIKKLELMFCFPINKIENVHKVYNECLSLTELEELVIDVDCINAPTVKYDNKIKDAYEKALKKINSETSNPLIVDFSKIKKMKNLKKIDIDITPYFGINISNTIEIINCKQLNDIRLKFDYRDLKIDINELNLIFDKISSDRKKFLIKMNKDKAYKDKDLIDSRYDLTDEDKEKYDQIEQKDERNIRINGENLSDIIFETYKKKVKK